MWGGVAPETHCSPLALCRHRSADYLLCIISMLAWLPNGQCQAEAKQSKIGMVRDNGSDSYGSYWCYGGASRPPSAGSGDSGGGEVGGTPPLESGVLFLPSPPTGTQLHINSTSDSDPIFNMGVDFMRPVFNLELKYGVTV